MQKLSFSEITDLIKEAERITVPSNPEANQKQFEEDVKNLPVLPTLPSLTLYIRIVKY